MTNRRISRRRLRELDRVFWIILAITALLLIASALLLISLSDRQTTFPAAPTVQQ